MDPDASVDTITDEVNDQAVTSENGTQELKKKPGKVPKRVHKSEREKLKRDHLNDLFLALANALGQQTLNNGKASILLETNKIINELQSQIDSLKKENAALLSESQYVSIEKDELKDDTFLLTSEIERLRIELHERILYSKPDLISPPLEKSPTPYANPFYAIPVFPDFSTYVERESIQTPTVSKPHARYPTPNESWPSQILKK